jgi:hypothetical protein
MLSDMTTLDPAALEDLIYPVKRGLSRLDELAQQAQAAGPDEKQRILAEARKAAQQVMGAAEELYGYVRSAKS